MINIKSSGRYYEYKIKTILEKNGFKVIRVPTSGTGKQPIPDIIAVRNNTIYAIEVKSTSKDYVNVDNFQIKKLFDFCEFFNFCNCKTAVIVNYKKYNSVLFYKLANYEPKIKFQKFEYGANGEALSSTWWSHIGISYMWRWKHKKVWSFQKSTWGCKSSKRDEKFTGRGKRGE